MKISESLSLVQYGSSPEPSTVTLHVAKVPCTTPRPATDQDATECDSKDEKLQRVSNERNDHFQSLGRDSEYFEDYCKQICSFMYFVTGGLDHQSLRDCLPEGTYPTLEEMKRIVGVIRELKDRIVDGGPGIQMVMGLLEDPAWSTNPVPKFETQTDRINYFIYALVNNPFVVLDFIHEINPALDIYFILSEHVFEGQQEHLNALKTKLRAHLYTRLALLADILFYGHFIRLPGEKEDCNTLWMKKRIASCFRPSPIANAKYGKVDLDEWSIKERLNPNDWTKEWDNW